MCGIVGAVSTFPVNQLLCDSLLLLQHRGQDAAGIATAKGRAFYMHKASGMVRDVFHTRNMRDLPGTCRIGQVRYPTTGTADCNQEAQSFYINAPYDIVLAHELQQSSAGYALEPDALFAAVSGLHARVRGSYAMVALISGHGLLCVRD